MIVEEQSIAYTNVVSREYFFTILIWKSNRRFIDRNCASEFNGQRSNVLCPEKCTIRWRYVY